MAKENVLRLLEASETDEALRREIRSAESADRVLAIGTERGFEFSAAELREVLEEIHQAETQELLDDALEKVAGGFGDPGTVKLHGGISLVKPVPALPFDRRLILETLGGFKSSPR